MATKLKEIPSNNECPIYCDFYKMKSNKNVKKLEKLQDTVDDSKDAEKFRILGELLTASLHTIKKGDKRSRSHQLLR